MTCQELREHSLDLLYDELAPDARAALERHAASCASCRAELSALRSTLQLTRSALQGALDEPAPPRVRAALRIAARQQLADAARPGFWAQLWHALMRPWLVPVLAGAAALVLVIARQRTPQTVWVQPREDRAESATRDQASQSVHTPSEAPAKELDEPTTRMEAPEPAAPAAAADARRSAANEREQTAAPRPRADAPPPAPRPNRSDELSPAATGEAEASEAAPTPKRSDTLSRAAAPQAPRPAAEPMPSELLGERAKKRSFAMPPAAAPPSLADADDARSLDEATMPSPRGQAASAGLRRTAKPARSANAEGAGLAAARAPAELESKSTASALDRAARQQEPLEANLEASGAALRSERAPSQSPLVQARELAQRIERANDAFKAQRWSEAAAEYRRLLRDYPKHRDAPVWRRRLQSAQTAQR